jgi:D-arabinose 1-dehydrogenase-like Zn-dependent alcohol dehydrogenase
MGYRTVAISTSGSKRAIAAELGAHEYIDASEVSIPEALQKLGGAKVIASTAPSPETLSSLVHGLQADGTLLVLGVIPEFTVPIRKLYFLLTHGP